MKINLLSLLLISLLWHNAAHAQITEDSLTNSILPELDLVTSAKKEEKKKTPAKKKKKKEYLGVKMKKQFTKVGSGPRQVIELFYYMHTYEDPNLYAQDVYWYDMKKKAISRSKNIDKTFMRPLHGPYKKFVGGKIIEEGYYYKGTKHGRWEQYNGNYALTDKTRYHRGWPEESQINYYDAAKTKIKEVIPIEFGVKSGKYYAFYEGGQVEVEGQYENNIKVGKWSEYYQFRRRKKKEIQFAPDAFTKNFEPFTLKEWDEKGNLIFDKEANAKDNLSKF
jgi:antitoxin component YwqK of YwqJK toxin-antitoxin module